MYDNNLNPEASHLRDVFLNAEREYVMELLKDPNIRNKICSLNHEINSETLFEIAQGLIDDVEFGRVPESEMSKVEGQITVVLAAIRDYTLRKELVLTPDYQEDEELSHGRGR